jgi:hypothetical protein
MAMVRIDALKTGSTLTKDVKNSQGQLLLRAGTVIQERHLMLLSSWGVVEVDILGDEAGVTNPQPFTTAAEAERARRLAEIKESLREKFQHTDLSSPIMAEILELCAQRKAKLSV